MLCVTGMYLRDMTNMILKILHLNVNHLSICSASISKWPLIKGYSSEKLNTLYVYITVQAVEKCIIRDLWNQ